MGGRCGYIVRVSVSTYAIAVVVLFLVFILHQLTALPEGQDNSINLNLNTPSSVTSPSKPEITYSCERLVDPQTGLVGIGLNFSYEYNPLIQEAISMYTVDALRTATGSNGIVIGSFTYDPALVNKVYIVIMRWC